MSTFEAIMNSILSMPSNFCLNTCLFDASSLIHIYLNHILLKHRHVYFSCYSWHVYVLHSGFACVAWTRVPTAHVRSGASARPTDATCKLEQTQNGVGGRSIPKWSTRNLWEFRMIHTPGAFSSHLQARQPMKEIPSVQWKRVLRVLDDDDDNNNQ